MIKNNKVINGVLLPKAFSLAVLVSLASAVSVYVIQDNVKPTEYTEKNNLWFIGAIPLLLICACADIYSDYKKNEKFLSLVARKYLKKEQKNNPTLKQFEKVLDNPQAMQNVSAVVFNNLRFSERERIIQIIANANKILRNQRKYYLDDTKSLKNTKEFLSDVRNQILTIIQEHMSVHPEFIGNVYAAMVSANMTYIMFKKPIQQHTK